MTCVSNIENCHICGSRDLKCIISLGEQCYSNKLKRIGVDPTGKQFKEYYGDIELIKNLIKTKYNMVSLDRRGRI